MTASVKYKTREETAKAILGHQNWKTMHELTPSRIMEAMYLATEKKDEYDPELVLEMTFILFRWGWFVRYKVLDKAPWEVTIDDLSAITERYNQDHSKKVKRGQYELFTS